MRPSWIGVLAVASSIACGSQAPACPGERITTDGETFCVVARDAGSAEATDPCAELRGIHTRIETHADGSRTSLLAETPLGHTTWSSGGTQLVHRDGWFWWLESNDQCGVQGTRRWWGFDTFRFRGDASGVPSGVTQACEPGTFPLHTASAALSSSGTHLACGEGHHPSQFVLCGTLGETPGTFAETLFLERPHAFVLGRRAEGFVLLHRNLDTGQRALELLDGAGRPERTVAIPDAPGVLRAAWVEQVGDQVWIGRSALADGEPPDVERIAVDAVLRTSEESPAPFVLEGFPSSSTLTPLSGAVARDDRVAFLLRETTATATRLHLAQVWADGRFATRLVSVGSHGARLAPWRSGFLIAAERPAADTGEPPAIELLRVDCGGRLLEPPIELAPSTAGLGLRALAALDEEEPRAWVVVSTQVEPNAYDHAVISVAPP